MDNASHRCRRETEQVLRETWKNEDTALAIGSSFSVLIWENQGVRHEMHVPQEPWLEPAEPWVRPIARDLQRTSHLSRQFWPLRAPLGWAEQQTVGARFSRSLHW